MLVGSRRLASAGRWTAGGLVRRVAGAPQLPILLVVLLKCRVLSDPRRFVEPARTPRWIGARSQASQTLVPVTQDVAEAQSELVFLFTPAPSTNSSSSIITASYYRWRATCSGARSSESLLGAFPAH